MNNKKCPLLGGICNPGECSFSVNVGYGQRCALYLIGKGADIALKKDERERKIRAMKEYCEGNR